MSTAQNNELMKLTPQQEKLLIDRYNHILELGGHKFISLTFCYLQTLYAEKVEQGKPTLSEAYTIGFDNIQMLIDVPFH